MFPKVIDFSQSTFIKGRGMLDSILIANELVNEIRRKKNRAIVVKVDFRKAFDLVSWQFLYYMMGRLGFFSKWIGWVKTYMESPTLLVLVNGSPTKEFQPKIGFRQGDPISPFLFLIVAEGLARMVSQAIQKNLYKGVKVGSKGIMINLLQFIDDTLFLCEPSLENIKVIKTILRCFEEVSSLRVNFHKTIIGRKGIEREEMEQFSGNENPIQIPQYANR